VRSVETLPPPLDTFRNQAAHEQRRRRRRRRRTSLGWAAAVALVVSVAAASVETRPPHTGSAAEARAAVTMVENPANIVWWAEGELHLANVTVGVPPPHHAIDHLTEINRGAVYGDDAGAVVFVGDDGVVNRIGTKTPAAPLVASDESGWVAWVDPRFESPQLVVYDVAARKVLASRTLPDTGVLGNGIERSHPIALDRDRLYYAARNGPHAWTVPDGATEPVQPAGLLAVAGGTRVWQRDPATIRMVQPFFSLSFDRSGTGAEMSADGNRVLTHTFGRGEGRSFGTVHLYDTRSGDRLWTGLTRNDVPIDATLGPETEVSYLITRHAEQPQHDGYLRQSSAPAYELRTCDHEAHRCRLVTRLAHLGMTPVLAR
jgi:hypothetical protein